MGLSGGNGKLRDGGRERERSMKQEGSELPRVRVNPCSRRLDANDLTITHADGAMHAEIRRASMWNADSCIIVLLEDLH